MKNGNISRNLWNVFEITSRAGKEASALLDTIGRDIEEIAGRVDEVRKITYLGSDDTNDDSDWVCLGETRTYDVTLKGDQIAKYKIGIQVIFFDKEASLTNEQATLNVALEIDNSKERFDDTNWFRTDQDWKRYSPCTNNMTLCYLSENEESPISSNGQEIYFSIPLGALSNIDNVKKILITPLEALLKNRHPEAEEVIEAFRAAENIIKFDPEFSSNLKIDHA